MNSKGKLIVIEGLDGCGKATQTAELTQRLMQNYPKVKHISFPNYSNPSSALVKMYLGGELGSSPDDVNAYAASSFYAVDRYASFKQFWEKDYNSGCIIIADRYTTSNAIYQLSKVANREKPSFLHWLDTYEYKQLQLPKPDAVIYLDMPVEVSQQLLAKRYNGDENKKDLHEKNFEFLKECRNSALYAAQILNWNVVSCAKNGKPRSIEDISDEVFELAKREAEL